MQGPRGGRSDGGTARRRGRGRGGRISLLRRQLEVLPSISMLPASPASWRRLTYPPYSPYPEAVREAAAGRCPPVPWRIGAIGGEEVLQQYVCAIADDWGDFRADRGRSPAREHIVGGRWRVKLFAGPQAGQHYEGQVVLDIFGRVCVHC
jgi:hypothetical protein